MKPKQHSKTSCRKCGGKMHKGKALQPIMTGMPDFPGDKRAVTLSTSNNSNLVPVLKCERCGHSVTY